MALATLTNADPLQLGRFTILARLGAGGMGVVYLAEDEDGTAAAVKVVKAELAEDPDFRARFRREVEAGRRVSGRCAARFLDADAHGRSPWLATEFVPGPTLHAEVHRSGPMAGGRLLGLAAGLADAIVAIHRAGLVHRDLKPANVLLAAEGPKVIDFGIALASETTMLTSTGVLVGSPSYMSPEQARGAVVGPESDVFAWGCCVVFAATGVPPFGEGQAAATLYRVVHDPPDLGDLALDALLAPLVAAALSKDAAARPTATELFATLEAAVVQRPAAADVGPSAPHGTAGTHDVAGTFGVAGAAGGAGAAGAAGAADAAAFAGGSGAEPGGVVPVDATAVLQKTWIPPADSEPPDTLLEEGRSMRAALPPGRLLRRKEEIRRRNRRNLTVFVAAMIAAVVLGILLIDPFARQPVGLAAGSGAGADGSSTSAGGLADLGAPVPTGAGAGATLVGGGPAPSGGATTAVGAGGASAGPAGGGVTVSTGFSGVVGPGAGTGPSVPTASAPATSAAPPTTATTATGSATTAPAPPPPSCTVSIVRLRNGAPSSDAIAFDRQYRVSVDFGMSIGGGQAWTATGGWQLRPTNPDRIFDRTGPKGAQDYTLERGDETRDTLGSTRLHQENANTDVVVRVRLAGAAPDAPATCSGSFRTPG